MTLLELILAAAFVIMAGLNAFVIWDVRTVVKLNYDLLALTRSLCESNQGLIELHQALNRRQIECLQEFQQHLKAVK